MIVNRRSALAPDPRKGLDLDQPRPGPPAPGFLALFLSFSIRVSLWPWWLAFLTHEAYKLI
ncbi:hypothetical protein NC651_033431 [Populus alba x Populus x berolinensis]|nr:hypothetical protein NC651_033431 [Populus alba x Populus x berolinensis]